MKMDEIALDAFNSDEAERRYLESKPTCFLVLGKQGCGKTTLARRFARTWKCILVTPASVIEGAMEKKSELGQQATTFLMTGNAVPDMLVLKLLDEKLNSEEVKHHGYILDGFPLLIADEATLEMQLDFIKSLALKPDYLINLKIVDQDLMIRRLGFKVDPVTNRLYPKSFYEPAEMVNVPVKDEEVDEEEEEEEEEGGEEAEEATEEEIEEEDLFDGVNFDEDVKDVIARLLKRRDELEENIVKSLDDYQTHILKKFEDFLGYHDQRKVIELDANIAEKELFKNLLSRLQPSLLSGTRVPLRLQGKEDQEEIGEDIDTEDMLRSLAASENISPGFRWRRSKWGRLCPVALSEGLNMMGNPLFAVSFLDKIYVMSSAEALDKFMANPRKFLLPPQPAPPCKVIVVGPPHAGCTTLAEKLCERYHAKRINVGELIEPTLKVKRTEMMTKMTEELIQNSILTVKTEEAARKKALEAKGSDSDSDGEKLEKPVEVVVEIDKEHPMVKNLINAGMHDIENTKLTTPAEEYVDCLEKALSELYVGTDKTYSSGGWVVDNFPQNRDHFSIMIERGIFPDEFIIFKDDTNENEVLVKRWKEAHSNGKSAEPETEESEAAKLQAFKEKIVELEHQLVSLQTSLRNAHNIEPLSLSCDETLEDAFMMCCKSIESSFQYHGWEYTGMDQDEEEEDQNAAAEQEELEDDEDEDPNKKKPFGETLHFCPVMLKEENVLAPGGNDFAVKYRERVYFLSSQENRQTFLDNTEYYLPQTTPLKLPAVRLLLHGAKGSGKTLHGRMLAKKFSIFHISFKDRLQELVLHKTMKKIGPEFDTGDEEKGGTVSEFTDHTDDGNEDAETVLELTEFEENIRNNILSDEPLKKETLDEILIPWWKEEPYKSTGFILEGFPRTIDEVKYLTSSGLYPDGTIFLNVDSEVVCDRLLPPIYTKWKEAKDKRVKERAQKQKEMLQKRADERTRLRAEKLEEVELRREERAAMQRDSDDEGDDDEEEDYDIDEMVEMEINDEFGEMEMDEEEEEDDEEATERIRGDLTEKCEEEMATLETVLEMLEDEHIPRLDIDASRKPHITQYILMKMLKSQVTHRDSLFDKCQSVTQNLALKLLNQGYKHASRFGRWCPVKLFDKDVLPPFVSKENPTFPVIYRDYIYFLSSDEKKERFMACPQKFINQAQTKPLVPIRIMIVGPPKSGKTTLANRFVNEFGVVRLSFGEILRKIIVSHAHIILVQEIVDFLTKGYIVPDELTVQALEIYLLDPQCVNRGFVLDGFPVTSKQMILLMERSIIPYKVIMLDFNDGEIMQRASVDRKNRTLPLHDSFTITAHRVAAYRKEGGQIVSFYEERYKNVYHMDGTQSKWLVYHQTAKEVQKALSEIQTYIQSTRSDRAAAIKHMCVTPNEFEAQLGEFGQYCAVSLNDHSELVDCSADTSNDLVTIYRGKYYKFENEQKMKKFIAAPSKYTPPFTLAELPSSDNLPLQRSSSYVKQAFPRQLEIKGYCPVTYLDGNLRYECIIPGDDSLVVEYRQKLYRFSSKQNLDKFLRKPKKYASLTLPTKLPPKREPISVYGLPMLGYMEQTVAIPITKALTSVGMLKPKHPFLTARRSALLYVAYHIKAHNPKCSQHVRAKYKKLLGGFKNNCALIQYLSTNMKKKYLDPEDRPIDFEHKLKSFLNLQVAV